MKLPDIDIPAGLEDAYNLIIRVLGGINPSTVLPKRLSPARRRYSEFAEQSYFVQLQDVYNGLSTFCKEGWTALWETLPFGSHGGAHGYPGSGYSAFIYINSPRYKAGASLIYCPFDQSISSFTHVSWPSFTVMNDIVWSPELSLFVAQGYFSGAGSSLRIFTSSNGINWTLRDSTGSASPGSLAWSPQLSLFVLFWNGGTAGVKTSPDGITWTFRTTPSTIFNISVCWSPELGLFCGFGRVGSTCCSMLSSDGINWSQYTFGGAPGFGNVKWNSALGLFVVSARIGGNHTIFTSPNGITWKQRASYAGPNSAPVSVSPYLTSKIVLWGQMTGIKFVTSLDSINWVVQSSAVFTTMRCMEYVDSLGVYFGFADNFPSFKKLFSLDGINWISLGNANLSEVRAFAYSPTLNKIVVVYNAGVSYATMV